MTNFLIFKTPIVITKHKRKNGQTPKKTHLLYIYIYNFKKIVYFLENDVVIIYSHFRNLYMANY